MGLPAIHEGTVRMIEGEPRIPDIRLGEGLGFAKPVDIRQLIQRNLNELESFAEVFCAVQKTSEVGGRPGTEYWLTEKQAILICMKSEAPRAADVRAEIVDVFYRWRHGEIVPKGETPVTMEALGTLFDAKLEPIHKEIKQIHSNVFFLARRVDDIVPRRDFPKETTRRWRYVLFRRYGNECPCCRDERIIDAEQKALPGLNYDHFKGRELNGPYDGWPVCTRCNLQLRDSEFKNTATKHFDVFHEYQRALLAGQPKLTKGDDKIKDLFDDD